MCGAGLASLPDIVQRMAVALKQSAHPQFSPARFGQLNSASLAVVVEQVAS